MATVDELLAGVSTVDKTLVISNDFRTINIPSSVPNLGVEYDDDVLRLDFKMPRYVSDTDLSEFSIRINYMNAQRETDVYTVRDKVVGSQYITFSWLVGPTATRYKGNTKFIVCAKITDADDVVVKEFNTTIATLPVLEGLEVDEAVVSDYTDVIEQWRRELFDNTDSEITKIQNASQREQVAINNKGAEVLATIPMDYRTAVSMTDNADRTKADAIVCDEQAEMIRVNDSSDDYLRGLKIFGKTTQVTTTGKNLLNVDEILSFTGLREKTVHIPAGTYILTWSSRTTTGQNKPVIRFAVNGILIDLLANSGNSEVTLTQDETTLYIYSNGYDYSASENVTATITQLMLSVDGGEYEPYSGGVASPCPEWSQDLVDIEGARIDMYGKNMLNLVSGYTVVNVTEIVNNGSVSFSGTASQSSVNLSHRRSDHVMLYPGTYTLKMNIPSGTAPQARLIQSDRNSVTIVAALRTDPGQPRPFTITEATSVYLDFLYTEGTKYDARNVTVQLERGSVATVYEPFRGIQTLTTPYTLSGIPVSQNGNYTDTDDQQWICDEVDFDRGLYIKRIGTKTFDGSTDELWYDELVLDNTVMFRIQIDDSVNIGNVVGKDYLCSSFPVKNMYNSDVEGTQHTMKQFYFRLNKSTLVTADLDGFRAYLAAHPMIVQYVLATPIETPLTAEEIEWFRFAHTNFPTTTVLNAAGATMELEYNADTRLWVDNIPKVPDKQVGPLVEAWMKDHFTDAEGVVYGKSAYEIARERGFSGSEEYWLASLKGRDGKDGKNGEPGADGKDGHTPVAGEDYFTEDDKEKLTKDVVDTLESGGSITIDDHVIEQGRNDIWTWRKWASGVAEIWGVVGPDITNGEFHSLPIIIWSNDPNVKFPVVTCSVENNTEWISNVVMGENNWELTTEPDPNTGTEVVTETRWRIPEVIFYEVSDGTITGATTDNYNLNVHMLGRWKPLE